MQAKVVNASDVEVFNVLGLPHAILAEPHNTSSGHEIVQVTGPVGAGVPPHVHENEDETFYVAQGEAVFVLDGREVAAPAGSAANLPRGDSARLPNHAGRHAAAAHHLPRRTPPHVSRTGAAAPGEPDLAAIAGICEKFDIRFV